MYASIEILLFAAGIPLHPSSSSYFPQQYSKRLFSVTKCRLPISWERSSKNLTPEHKEVKKKEKRDFTFRIFSRDRGDVCTHDSDRPPEKAPQTPGRLLPSYLLLCAAPLVVSLPPPASILFRTGREFRLTLMGPDWAFTKKPNLL
jgi:hypothetical protein